MPGLFATLGLDVTGARLDADAAGARLGADAAGAKLDAGNAGAEPAAGRTRDGIAPLPPRRMIGDAGACPGATRPPHELAEDDENPRARIVRAAILLQRGAPPAPSPCRETVLSAARR